MYNLLVSHSGWQPSRDTIARERAFEYTTEALSERFSLETKAGRDAVIELPTLFMSEGVGSQVARVGTITRIRTVGRDYEIEYSLDRDMPTFTNSDIKAMAGELGIKEWELSRTHWAVKEADLFYVLLRGKAKRHIPKVFNIGDEPVNEDLVAVMMPFAAEFDKVYAALREAADARDKVCQRADDMWKNDAIIQDIVSLICTAHVVICDLTGRNSNVFYEAGIAHTIGKDVILITQSDNDVPFNLRHLRYIKYLNNNQGLIELGEQVRKRLRTLDNALRRG